jgi:hypothetical protein
MQFGYNQNIKYKGKVYHIQTEDGGRNNPVVTTQLFRGGAIIASRRTNYLDIMSSEELESCVKDIVREQHKSIIKDLTTGALDDRLEQ